MEQELSYIARQEGVYSISVLSLMLNKKRAGRIISIKLIMDQLKAIQFGISTAPIQFIFQEAE